MKISSYKKIQNFLIFSNKYGLLNIKNFSKFNIFYDTKNMIQKDRFLNIQKSILEEKKIFIDEKG